MTVKHTPIPVAAWSFDTARGRQRSQDLETLLGFMLPKVSPSAVIDVLSKPLSDTAVIAAGPVWAKLIFIINVLGPDYTRTQFTDAVDHASCFLNGPIGPQQAARYARWGKSDAGTTTTC